MLNPSERGAPFHKISLVLSNSEQEQVLVSDPHLLLIFDTNTDKLLVGGLLGAHQEEGGGPVNLLLEFLVLS